jgi:hypothetical protein
MALEPHGFGTTRPATTERLELDERRPGPYQLGSHSPGGDFPVNAVAV